MENSYYFYKMTKTVTHIDCPKEWESTNDWDSHRPLLWLTVNNIDGGMVEFGSGDGSTKLLKDKLGGLFTSFDNNKEWCEKTGSRYSSDLTSIGVTWQNNLMCVFIDAAPGEIREKLIKKWANIPILVIHDTEPGAEYVYHMAEILSTFKYRLNYEPIGKPHTTVVSNFIDVTTWI